MANPIVNVIMVDGKRFYKTSEGQLYPSVTTILSSQSNEGLDKWREVVGQAEAETITRVAANKGTDIHNAIEKYLKNEENPTEGLMPDIKAMFLGMKKFLNNINPIWAIEQVLWSHKYKFAGRCDVIADYMQSIASIDFKNHRSDLMYADDKIHKYLIQCSAYAVAFEEMIGTKINKAVLLFGSNDYGASEHITYGLDEYKQEFLNLRKDLVI